MAEIWFDHFITYTSAADIDDYLEEYSQQGFFPEETTVRHEPGLRNGFIFLGPEYIEFCWVEDERLFDKADEEEKLFRALPRPFGIGMITEDVHEIHDDWTARGYSAPEVFSKAPRDAPADAPPAWSFQEIPGELLPGASCFALTYHKRRKQGEKKIKIHPNTIFAVAGVTFVSSEPEARARRWRDVLAPEEQIIQSRLGFCVVIGPHQAWWMTPDAYHSTSGLDWGGARHPYGEIAVLHLLAADLDAAKNMLVQSGRQVVSTGVEDDQELLVMADARDGFIFSIQQQHPETWLQERMARTGENIRFVQD